MSFRPTAKYLKMFVNLNKPLFQSDRYRKITLDSNVKNLLDPNLPTKGFSTCLKNNFERGDIVCEVREPFP